MWPPSGVVWYPFGLGSWFDDPSPWRGCPLQDRQLNGSWNHDRVAREHGVPENSIKFALRSQVREPTNTRVNIVYRIVTN